MDPTTPPRPLVIAAAAALALLACLLVSGPADAYVYTSDSGSGNIALATLDGTSSIPTFIQGAGGPEGVAVDGQYLYWADAGAGTIGRANLDGSGVNASFITGASTPDGVAVDGQHVYWTNFASNTIGRSSLDGTGANQAFVTGANRPFGVAVDGRHVYWTNFNSGTIGRSNLDGSSPAQSFITTLNSPIGVAVDGQRVYWTNLDDNTIGRASLDGTGTNQAFVTGANQPFGIAVDGRHLYWGNDGNGTVGRANLDGSGVSQAFLSGVGDASGIAVDSGPAGRAGAGPSSLAFPTQPLGLLSGPQTVVVTNTGHGDLHPGGATVSGAAADEFLISSDGCAGVTLAVGASCAIHVRFGPAAAGARSATLAVPSDDPVSPAQIPLTGTGGALPQGPQGPAGSQGPAGPAGVQGAGQKGAPGPAGRVELVVCRRVVVHGRRRQRCTTRLVTRPLRFTATTSATLVRAHTVVAAGAVHGGRLVLRGRSALARGRYTLWLRDRGRPATRRPLTLR